MEKVVMNLGFWKGKRVLITGHTGFKGSWMALWLSELGAQVVGYSLPPAYLNGSFSVAHLAERMHSSVEADICNLSTVTDCIASNRPDIVFHMAAQPLVRFSYNDPVGTFQTNIMGTINLLEAIRREPSAKAVVVVTSDKCYKNREWVWGYREHEAMGGEDPYSSSKGCAELVTASYRSSFFLPDDYVSHGVALATARAGNVIGGGDWSVDRLIPDLLRAHFEGKDLQIRNPDAIRPWQFVLEPLAGYLVLAERLFMEGAKFAEAWNFGPRQEDAISVESLVKRFSALLEGGVSYSVRQDRSPHEAKALKLDCSKAEERLGWRPRTRINDALRFVADWYNCWKQGVAMRELMLKQISDFETAIKIA